MIATIVLDGQERRVDLARGTSLAIAQGRDGQHPRFFVDRTIDFQTLQGDGFCGNVARGGSCNVERIDLIPHCHGTHTEGVGHITRDARAVQDGLETGLMPAALVSVTPVEASRSSDSPAGDGPLISADMLEWPRFARALMIRTLPNPETKCTRHYDGRLAYPLLSIEAMEKIAAGGIEHLLIDTPSVDAANDGGKLLQHRRFWHMPDEAISCNPARASCTITEMIFAADVLSDGPYLLSLGVSPLRGDAAPSAPMVFQIQ